LEPVFPDSISGMKSESESAVGAAGRFGVDFVVSLGAADAPASKNVTSQLVLSRGENSSSPANHIHQR
jgi:hypothetical protein